MGRRGDDLDTGRSAYLGARGGHRKAALADDAGAAAADGERPGAAAARRIWAGHLHLAGWIGHNGSLPGYQSVVVYLPEQNRTLVILINTDIDYHGSEPSSTLATAITSVISPGHVYSLSPEVQEPDVTPSSTPTKPR